jgi:hypothetical protein
MRHSRNVPKYFTRCYCYFVACTLTWVVCTTAVTTLHRVHGPMTGDVICIAGCMHCTITKIHIIISLRIYKFSGRQWYTSSTTSQEKLVVTFLATLYGSFQGQKYDYFGVHHFLWQCSYLSYHYDFSIKITTILSGWPFFLKFEREYTLAPALLTLGITDTSVPTFCQKNAYLYMLLLLCNMHFLTKRQYIRATILMYGNSYVCELGWDFLVLTLCTPFYFDQSLPFPAHSVHILSQLSCLV